MKKILTLCSLLTLVLFSGFGATAATPPGASFSPSVSSGCAPLVVDFYNASSGAGFYSWNFGDPGSGTFNLSPICSPSHTFNNPGTYTVTLTFTTGTGTYTATTTITVYPRPNPVISGKDTTCEDQVYTYSVIPAPGHSYLWSVNNGSIVGANNGSTVNVRWSSSGNQVLSITQTSPQGCSKTATRNVLVVPLPQFPFQCSKRKGSAGQNPDGNSPTSCVCAYDLDTFDIPNPYNYTFTWTVTGGTLISGQGTGTAVILWGAGPTATVQVIGTSPFGCTDTAECKFNICPKPNASAKADTVCVGNPTQFNASASSPAISSYHWWWGDNTDQSSNNPLITHTYANAGVYTVKLRVWSGSCFDDTTFKVKVNPGSSPPIGCGGTVCHNSRQCYGTPYYPGAVYSWQVTGQTSYIVSPNGDSICVTWGNGPQGVIKLQVTGGPYTCGSSTLIIPIFPKHPQIIHPASLCLGEANLVSAPHIPGTCYSWSVSNGNFGPANNSNNAIWVKPNALGVDTIRLSMVNDITCCKKDTFIVIPVKQPLAINGLGTPCPYSTWTYNSAGVPVTWLVSGGTVISSTATTVTVTWGNGPNAFITATAVNPAPYCTASITVQINIKPVPPNPPIAGPAKLCKGQANLFSYIPDPDITGSVWSISPGTGFTASNPQPHQYSVNWNTTGNYTITVTYTASSGCTSSSSIQVTVLDTAKPVITGPSPVCFGAPPQLYTIPSNPGGIYQWSVIGGTIVSGQGNDSLFVQWGNINQGQIWLTNTLCGGVSKKLVTILNQATGIITFKDTTCSGTSIKLVASPGYSYSWSPGGATSQIITITSPGTYTVTLTAAGKCPGTVSVTLATLPKLPAPNINIVPSSLAQPYCPPMYNLQVNPALPTFTYQWSPTGQTQSAIQDSTRNKTHTVIVTNQYGCKDTAAYTIPNVSCTPGSGAGNGTPCTVISTLNISYDQCTGLFSSTSTNITQLFWNFGDGYYANGSTPQHWYGALNFSPGYIVTVTALQTNGCWVIYKFVVPVNSILRGKVKHWLASPPCNYKNYNFSVIPAPVFTSSGTITYNWSFGDPSSGVLNNSTLASPSHNFTGPGTFIVSVSVNDGFCSKTFYDTLKVADLTAGIFACPGCNGKPVQFVDQSTGSYPIVNWAWNFGDATTSNLQNPFHVYPGTGPYTASLTVTDNNGCTANTTFPITINVFTAAPLTFTNNGSAVTGTSFTICQGDVFVATAPTGFNFTYAWSNGITTRRDTISQTGLYWCVVTDGNTGCHDTLGPFTVIVNPKPNATITGLNNPCGPTTLSALTGAGYSYQWLFNGSPIPFETSSTHYAQNSGNYQVVVTNAFGCSATSPIHSLNILPLPNINLNTYYQAICEKDSVVLLASFTGSPAVTSWSWNTGQTGNTITVFTGGAYTVTGTGSNGCKASTTATIVVNPLPDVSIIPKGCYKVCKGQKPKVCGPIPTVTQVQQGQSFSYTWYQNGNPVSTNPNYTVSANGTYWLTVTNTVTGCTNTSAPFDVTYVNGPGAIITPGGNPVICTGAGGGVILHGSSNPSDPSFQFQWLHNGVVVGNGTDYTATAPGEYVLHVFKSECCESHDTIVIKEEDCCWDSMVQFTYIPDGYSIYSNEVWDGKYYIAGKVHVYNNSIFDLTEVDCVFDEDGEIIFHNTSFVRANNSVFRPCFKDSIWVGFTFLDSSAGLIHTSLYKNARIANNINNKANYSVRITDNTYSNCNVGISVSKPFTRYTEGITSNSFVIENTKLPYGTNDYFGIRLNGVTVDELISQNNFRSSDFSNQTNRYFGIYSFRSSATVSENTFSNMYRSMDLVTSSGSFNVENNEIEITQNPKIPNDHQIRITNSSAVILVFANELRHSISANTSSIGIYLEKAVFVNVKDNNIKGFHTGIRAINCASITITENDIDMGDVNGIYVTTGSLHNISCNVIRMKKINSSVIGFGPTGIRSENMDQSTRIYTNCIYDCGRAMLLTSIPSGNSLPVIRNNFMYNYHRGGIWIQGHTPGNLGTGGTFGTAGRNSFVSNNRGAGTLDIFNSTGILQEGGNFGVFFTSGTTNMGGLNKYGSTASCGQQIINPPDGRIDQYNICDNYRESLLPIDITDLPIGIKPVIKSDTLKIIKGLVKGPETGRMLVIAQIIGKFSSAADIADCEAIIAKPGYSDFDRVRMRYELLISAGKLYEAMNAVNSFVPSGQEQTDWQEVYRSHIRILMKQELSSAEKTSLSKIDTDRGELAPVARDILHMTGGDHDYIFDYGTPEPQDEPGMVHNLDGSYLKMFPNPGTDMVMLDYHFNTSSPVNYVLTDIQGKIIRSGVMNGMSGTQALETRNLSAGIYMIRLESEGKSLSGKWMKVTD